MGNYFDNDICTKAVIKYQRTHNMREIEKIFPQFTALVRGVINTHKIYRFWNNTEELMQEGTTAMIDAFDRFDKTRGTTLFSYLSIVVKQHLKNWTKCQNKLYANTVEFQDAFYEDDENSTDYIEEFTLCNYFPLEKLPENLQEVSCDIDRAIKDYRINNYQDLNKWLREQGWSTKDLRLVMKTLKKHFSETSNFSTRI